MSSRNVLVTGGTGFVGRRLVQVLAERGDTVTVVSRDPAGARRHGIAGVSYRGWLPSPDAYDAVVNLAGTPIFGQRWNESYQADILNSRVDATRTVVKAIAESADPPDVLVNASAIGFYGDRGEEELSESAGPGSDFMAGVCQAWEEEARKCPVRTVCLRTGVVLGPDGGALKLMLPPFRFGLGGNIGLGRAWFSWIHLDDLVGLILFAIGNRFVEGPLNATAPGACLNKDYTSALGRVLRRPTLFPVPPIALRLMFGPVSAVLTASQRCIPKLATDSGYSFEYPEVEGALRNLLER